MNPDPYVGIWGGKLCRNSPVQTTRHCDCSADKCLASARYYEQLEQIFKYSLPRGKCAGVSIQFIVGSIS